MRNKFQFVNFEICCKKYCIISTALKALTCIYGFDHWIPDSNG